MQKFKKLKCKHNCTGRLLDLLRNHCIFITRDGWERHFAFDILTKGTGILKLRDNERVYFLLNVTKGKDLCVG